MIFREIFCQMCMLVHVMLYGCTEYIYGFQFHQAALKNHAFPFIIYVLIINAWVPCVCILYSMSMCHQLLISGLAHLSLFFYPFISNRPIDLNLYISICSYILALVSITCLKGTVAPDQIGLKAVWLGRPLVSKVSNSFLQCAKGAQLPKEHNMWEWNTFLQLAEGLLITLEAIKKVLKDPLNQISCRITILACNADHVQQYTLI